MQEKKYSYIILDLHNQYFKKNNSQTSWYSLFSAKKRIQGISVIKFLVIPRKFPEIPRKFPESFRPIPSSDGNCPYHFQFRFRENISEFVSVSENFRKNSDRQIPFSKIGLESGKFPYRFHPYCQPLGVRNFYFFSFFLFLLPFGVRNSRN